MSSSSVAEKNQLCLSDLINVKTVFYIVFCNLRFLKRAADYYLFNILGSSKAYI